MALTASSAALLTFMTELQTIATVPISVKTHANKHRSDRLDGVADATAWATFAAGVAKTGDAKWEVRDIFNKFNVGTFTIDQVIQTLTTNNGVPNDIREAANRCRFAAGLS
jgi:hypothetical protein